MAQMTYLGIDVGKDNLVIARQVLADERAPKAFEVSQCRNEITQIDSWLHQLTSEIDKQSVHIVFEATGNYSHRLAYCLAMADMAYSLINPKQSHGFATTMKVVNQNDERDAILLCLYGHKHTPDPTVLADEHLHQLRQKRHHLTHLMKQKQAIDNQIHALGYDPRADNMVYESLLRVKEMLEQQIDVFKNQLFDLDDEQYQQIYKKLITITGIGDASASALIIATNGFKDFDNVKQVCKFLGTIPNSKESGISVKKKGHIIKSGVPYVRATLYCAAKSAARFNRACKELYQRLRKKGKCHKVAMIAVVNKLIKQAFAIVKNNIVFDNNFAYAK